MNLIQTRTQKALTSRADAPKQRLEKLGNGSPRWGRPPRFADTATVFLTATALLGMLYLSGAEEPYAA